MRPLTASELLNVWEYGLAQSTVQRALILLGAACPESSAEELAALSLGQRDARLLMLRQWTFGSTLSCVATCPQCGERVELNFNTADILVAPEAQLQALSIQHKDHEVHFRLPTSADLLAIANKPDRTALLQRCILSVVHKGKQLTPAKLSSDMMNLVAQRMSEIDSQSDVELALNCPACGHPWLAAFDVLSFFWSEIHVWALRILREVHILASAYSWSEADILAMSTWRRNIYLELVGQ